MTNKVYKVLLVDDETVSRDFVRHAKIWRDHQFQLVKEATNGIDAIEILKKSSIDIVIFDVHMPQGDGVALSDYIAANFPDISMLAISSYDNYDYVRRILKNGAHDYILKHKLDGNTLTSTLYQMIENRKLINAKSNKVQTFENSIYKWIFEEQPCPFEKHLNKIIFSIIRIKNLPNESIFAKNAAIDGIIKILMEVKGSQYYSVAICHNSNSFIVCLCVDSMLKDADISDLQKQHMKECQNEIGLAYKSEIIIKHSPFFHNYEAYPSYVKHTIEEFENTEIKRSIILTIAQRKALLEAIEFKNIQKVEKEITSIYTSSKNSTEYIIITRELLEIASTIAREYDVDLSFLLERKDLYSWIRSKNTQQLMARVIGLFRQVMSNFSSTSSLGANLSNIVKEADDFLLENYKKQVSLRDVASHLGVNHSYLSRRFKKETGITIIQRLNTIRIDAAKVEINNGYHLKEVASKCGFSSYNYFFTVFREYEGTTPKDYIQSK